MKPKFRVSVLFVLAGATILGCARGEREGPPPAADEVVLKVPDMF